MADDNMDEAREQARLEAVAEREKAVDASLRAGKTVQALTLALENPPFASKNSALKDKNSVIIMKALTAVAQKEADVAAFLDSISADGADNLMKYIYKALAKPDQSGMLLKVHAQLVEKHGLGCIVRAITDRKTA
jgi:hypothetical protein